MLSNNVVFAFILTVFAGLSTGVGGLCVLLFRKTNTKFLSVILGFSAGVMIYVSTIEMFADAKLDLIKHYGESTGYWITVLAFFGGILLIALIDKFVPSYENPHETHRIEETESGGCKFEFNSRKLLRTGILTALVITIHNFPEGIATLVSALKSPSLGIAIAFAIAIHNIPEGIAVSIPVYCATGSRKKAFFISLFSGFAEPLGAIIGYFLLVQYLNDVLLGIVFAAVAGIMVFISLDELLPTAREYGEHHLAMYGLVAGMFVMAVSLILFV